MGYSKLILLQEVDTGFYRIAELYPTSDGMRSRLAYFRNSDLNEANKEMTRRQNIIDGEESS